MNETTIPEAKVDGFINFHGIPLMVVVYDDQKYVQAKPLADFACVDWRTAKRAFLDPENVKFYGTKELKLPEMAAQGGELTTSKSTLHILLSRSRMYLARINTKVMRNRGKEEAADFLLSLVEEWGDALNDYETKGYAVKDARRKDVERDQKSMIDLLKARELAKGKEKFAIDLMLKDRFEALGFPLDEVETNQPDLFDQEGESS